MYTVRAAHERMHTISSRTIDDIDKCIAKEKKQKGNRELKRKKKRSCSGAHVLVPV